jgi:hypothetical protein
MRQTTIAFVVATMGLAYAGPAKEKAWHDQADKDLKDNHVQVTKSCGHDVVASLDWSSGFKYDDWTVAGSPGSVCVQDVLDNVAYFCRSDDEAFKTAAKKIKTLTCHYKACDRLPGVDPTKKRAPENAPGIDYALTKDGTNLDKTFCEKSSTSTNWDSRWWLKEHL